MDEEDEEEDADDDEEADEDEEDADGDREAEAEEEFDGCSLPEHPRLDLKGDGPHPLALKESFLVGRNDAYHAPVGRRKQATVVPRDGVRRVAATQIFKALAPRPLLFHV